MQSALLTAMLDSPMLPELLQEARGVLEREQARREKFYKDITPEHKWEFIQGEVIMHSPAQLRHLEAVGRLNELLRSHVRRFDLGKVFTEKAMVVFPRNDYEPDVVFFDKAKVATLKPDTLKFPIPNLVIEVLSPSTEKRDRGIKLQDYALHGVGEYWIVDPVAETVELYRLEGDAYPTVEAKKEGTLKSEVVRGFEIPMRAIFSEAEFREALKKI